MSMELDKINSLIFETLDSIAPISTSRVSMFNTKDKYYYVPFCRFKFKNKEKEDKIYKKIQVAIDSFEGNLEWKLLTKVESKNFLIVPIISGENEIAWNDKESIISLIGESGYHEKIDECIDDIPKLAKVISANFQDEKNCI